jgi:hypothetical protein
MNTRSTTNLDVVHGGVTEYLGTPQNFPDSLHTQCTMPRRANSLNEVGRCSKLIDTMRE